MEQSAMNDLPQHVHDEGNGLDYTLYGDYYLPDLELPKEQRPIGRWGKMRLEYLKEHYGLTYNEDSYIVNYEALGSNLMPDVTVMEKQDTWG